MKITSRSIILWNIILFSILSIGLFHISGSSLVDASAFSGHFFKISRNTYLVMFALVSLSFLSIYFVMGVSKLLYILTVVSISILTALQLTENFSKLILVMLFLYLIIAYYYYQFLNIEIKQACYKPNFNEQNLFDPMLYKISCYINLPEDKVVMGYLTNWDENGCFVKFSEPQKLPKEFTIKIEMAEELFIDHAKVVSKLGNAEGYGLKFKHRPAARQSWIEFINFTSDMGLLPETIQ